MRKRKCTGSFSIICHKLTVIIHIYLSLNFSQLCVPGGRLLKDYLFIIGRQTIILPHKYINHPDHQNEVIITCYMRPRPESIKLFDIQSMGIGMWLQLQACRLVDSLKIRYWTQVILR